MSAGQTAAERKRRQRERQRAAAASPILYEQADWRDFINPGALPRKAGCAPNQLGRVVLKEMVDNALDAGAGDVTLTGDARCCAVADDGPGIDPDQVLRLFAVNRLRISSKMKRLPTRGMLGNGLRVVMGAVAALGGTISVTTRGRRSELGTNTVTGATEVRSTADVPEGPGVTVEVKFPKPTFDDDDYSFARRAIALARHGNVYDGPSMPSWYGKTDLEMVLAAAPKDLTRDEVLLDLFGTTAPADMPVDIGAVGAHTFRGYYHKVQGTSTIEGATVPFTVEAWVSCKHVENGEDTDFYWHPLINRTLALAKFLLLGQQPRSATARLRAQLQSRRGEACGIQHTIEPYHPVPAANRRW